MKWERSSKRRKWWIWVTEVIASEQPRALSTLKIWVKRSGVNCAQHPKGRWRQLTPDPFT